MKKNGLVKVILIFGFVAIAAWFLKDIFFSGPKLALKRLTLDLLGALNKGDAPALADCLTDDFQIVFEGKPGQLPVKQLITQALKEGRGTFDAQVEFQDIRVDGDLGVVEAEFDFSLSGEGVKVKPTVKAKLHCQKVEGEWRIFKAELESEFLKRIGFRF